jgi:phosphoribosyl 1,2-cyclic phosphate phosphodiesterase
MTRQECNSELSFSFSCSSNLDPRTSCLTFLGTGGAWGLPELNCECRICSGMRARQEMRSRTALLLSGETNLLIDCGPDIRLQLSDHAVRRIDGVLLTHEHGDHYLGLDDLFAFKRARPRGQFMPIPVFVSAKSWETIRSRFGYLVGAGVIAIHEVEPGRVYGIGQVEFSPFKTTHGAFALGSVGFQIRVRKPNEKEVRLVYTSDFTDVPGEPQELFAPDFLILQSYWFNEPEVNRPNHMSFQRGIELIRRWQPRKETFLVHFGDADMVAGDPANTMSKKAAAKDPLTPPSGGKPYPVPLHQEEWQETVNRVLSDYRLPHKVTVAWDGMKVEI